MMNKEPGTRFKEKQNPGGGKDSSSPDNQFPLVRRRGVSSVLIFGPSALWGSEGAGAITAFSAVAMLRSITLCNKHLDHSQNPNCLDLNMHEKLPRKD